MKKYIYLTLGLVLISFFADAQTWTLNGPTTICSGQQNVSYTLQSSGGGLPAGSVYWSVNGQSVIGNGFTNQIDFPSSGSSFVVRAVNLTVGADVSLNVSVSGDPGTISLNGNTCSGASVSVSASGHSGNVVWLKRVGTGLWYEYQTIGFPNPLNDGDVSVGTQYQYRTAVTTACGTEYSNIVTVTPRNSVSPGTAGGGHSICYGSSPTQNITGGTASGGSGSYTYSWSKRTNGGPWVNIGGGATLSPSEIGTLTQDTDFKRKVTDAECGATWGNVVTITVDPLAEANPINLTAEWCGTATGITMTSSAAVGYLDKWQYRYKNGSGSYGGWNLITHTNNASPVGLDVTEWSGGDRTYQVRTTVRSGQCVDYAYAEIVVHPTPGLASGNDVSRCGPGPVTLTAAPGSNGNTIRWYSSSSGGTPIHTGTSYSITSLSSTTTYYARSYNSSTLCEDDQMKAITATITPLVGQVSTPSGQSTVCQTSTQNYTASASNATSYTWSLIPSNAGTINASGQVNWSNEYSGNAIVRVVAHGCNSTSTADKTVNVLALVGQVSVPSGANELCQGTSYTYSASADDATGYTWSINPSSAGSINSSGQLSLNGTFTGALTITVVANGNCATSSTANKQITVNPNVAQVTTPSGTNARCEGSGTTSYTASASNATGYTWSIAPAAAGSINSSGLVTWDSDYYGTATVTVVASGECGPSTSADRLVTVYQQTEPGTISGAVQKFEQATGTLTLTGAVGDVLRWEKKTTGSWQNITSTQTTLDYDVSESTYYRAIVNNSIVCDEVPSDSVLVEILGTPELDVGASQHLRPGDEVVVSVTDGYSYQWFLNNTVIPSESSHQLVVDQPGTYKVVITSTEDVFTFDDIEFTDQLTINENAIITYQYRVPTTNVDNPYAFDADEQSISSQIFDGLGRPVQQVLLGASPQLEDVVTPMEYDDFGRQVRNYLPYVDTELSSIYKPNALNPAGPVAYPSSDHYDYYMNQSVHNTAVAYAETLPERSPMARPLEQGAPAAGPAHG